MESDTAGDWVDAMAVAVELVASRWTEGLAAPELLRMAEHQSNAGLTPVICTGSHSLNDPAWLLPAWLQHLTRHGTTVAAGSVVTTGSWVGCLPIQPGDRVSVDFAGLGNLTVWL